MFHVSERPDIEVFEPRLPPSPGSGAVAPVVWAIDEPRLPNYLLPRECPRVAFRALASSSAGHRERFLGSGATQHVVAIESRWFERASTTSLWVYEFSHEAFVCADAIAGYFVSVVPVVPLGCRNVECPLSELVGRGVELRVVPDLSALASAVASSTLGFSCIRMRNASSGQNAL